MLWYFVSLLVYFDSEGFGEASSDYWLGLRKLYQLTQSRCYTLGVQYNINNGSYYQRYYRQFQVKDETENFAMNFSTTSSSKNYLGDCLSDVKHKPFSTYDADHDDDATINCAELYHSGWWFKNCTLCNPTGVLIHPTPKERTEDSQVFWTPGLGDLVPGAVFLMLLRC